MTKQITNSDLISEFDCGSETWAKEIASFLKDDALRQQLLGLSKTILFFHRERCVAFVTLVASSLRVRNRNAALYSELPDLGRNEQPCILVAQLAVCKDYQGQGVGSRVLEWVIAEVLTLSVGVRLLTLHVDKGNDRALEFYEQNGFHSIPALTDSKRQFMFYDLHQSA